MNCEIHQLAPLRCEAFQAKEVMRAVLHTVLFTRALGVVRPRDVDCEMFDLSYATCGDPAVDAAVEARLDALQAWLRRETRAGGETHARVTLFHELQHVGPGPSGLKETDRVLGTVARASGGGGGRRGTRARGAQGAARA